MFQSTSHVKISNLSLSRRLDVLRGLIFVAVHALALLALVQGSWAGLGALLFGYVLTGALGISIGYHRLLSHGSFRSPSWLRNVFCVLGTLALQGGPISWVAFHRAHHRYAGRVGDPHSRNLGFLWSHFAWSIFKAPNGFRRRDLKGQVRDLAASSFLWWLEKYSLELNLAAFALGGGLLGWSVALWAFPLRIVLVWHLTWLVNSWAHEGEDSSADDSRNLQWLALLTFGEGLHRNHHRHPARPVFAEARGEIDLSGLALVQLERFGLVQFPSEEVEYVGR